MLNSSHFYHRIVRKLVVAFGTMFNNLQLVRYNRAGTIEVERVTVPLTYAGKEKFYARITQDPNLNKEIMMTLPRMSFELTGITYDPLRKISTQVSNFGTTSGGTVGRVKATPYNFEFTLNIYVRNTEDGTQIVEQILPYFSPDYTVTVDLVGLNGLKVDVPIILNNVTYQVDGDTGVRDELRVITWTLTFTAKGYLYGLVNANNNNKLITKVYANTFEDVERTGERRITLNSGVGEFKIGELVYEGRKVSVSNATAYVKTWNATSNSLIVYDSSGVLESNRTLKGAVSGASWNIVSFDTNPYQLVELTVTPDPPTANANDDFGFTITIEEYPDIT